MARMIAGQLQTNIMPLGKGSSRATVSSNIELLLHEWQKDGLIGSSHPATRKKALKQAVAIALSKAGRSRNPTGAQTHRRKTNAA
jgi:hypothetical protein